MKIQLDFDREIITIEDNVNLGEFVKKIKKIIPDWKEWSVETNTTINWGYSYPYYYNWPMEGTLTTTNLLLDGTTLTTSDIVNAHYTSGVVQIED